LHVSDCHCCNGLIPSAPPASPLPAQVFDKDNQGWISTTELRHVLSNLGEKLSPQEMEEMIKESDPDNDGKIQLEEFVRMLLAR
jgi:calmodulin